MKKSKYAFSKQAHCLENAHSLFSCRHPDCTWKRGRKTIRASLLDVCCAKSAPSQVTPCPQTFSFNHFLSTVHSFLKNNFQGSVPQKALQDHFVVRLSVSLSVYQSICLSVCQAFSFFQYIKAIQYIGYYYYQESKITYP